MDDSNIVDLYLSRDESAIFHTAKKYGRKLKQIANNILHDMETSEECENETYLRAWNSIPPNEPRTYFFAFLGKIIRHLAIDECRKNKTRKHMELFLTLSSEMEECIPEKMTVEEGFAEELLIQSINRFLSNCTEEQRNIFVKRYWYFDSISEISREYRCSQSKIKTMLFRMRQNLRAQLEKDGYEI